MGRKREASVAAAADEDVVVSEIVRESTRQLEAQLTESEVVELSREHCRVLSEIGSLQMRKRAMDKEFNAQIDEASDKAVGMQRTIVTGTELREVDVHEVLDYRTGLVTVIRRDTGEVIESREMTAEERQLPIPGTEPGSESLGDDVDPFASDDGRGPGDAGGE